jgi:hypothetical protein
MWVDGDRPRTASSMNDVGPEPETVLIVDDDRAVLNGLGEP